MLDMIPEGSICAMIFDWKLDVAPGNLGLFLNGKDGGGGGGA